MRTYPSGSPQEAYVILQRILESIQGINTCLPTASGVQDATAGLINSCTESPLAQSVLDIQIQTALCWIGTQLQNGPTNIVIDGGVDYVVQGITFNDNLFIWECFAKSFSFPTLTTCNQGLFFSTNSTDGNMSFLVSIDISKLTTVNSILFISREPNLISVDARALVHVGQDIDVSSNASLTTVNFESVEFIGRDFLASGSLINGLKLPNLSHFGGTQFLCDSNSIPAEDVNALLITLASLGLSGVAINFSGGANGAPTGAGLTAKSTLQGQGNTVATN